VVKNGSTCLLSIFVSSPFIKFAITELVSGDESVINFSLMFATSLSEDVEVSPKAMT